MLPAMQLSHEISVCLILRILQPSQARFTTFRPDMLSQLPVAPWHQGHRLAYEVTESHEGCREL
jgi:hypothetical protein